MRKLVIIIVIIILILVVFFLGFRLSYYESEYRSVLYKLNKANAENKRVNTRVRELQRDNEAIQNDFKNKINKIVSQWCLTSGKLQSLQKSMAVAIDLVPGLEEMVDSKIAGSFNDQFHSLENEKPSIKLINKFRHCLDEYNSLTKQQQELVTVDIEKINSLYTVSLRLKHKKRK